jgi:hypothetical protein
MVPFYGVSLIGVDVCDQVGHFADGTELGLSLCSRLSGFVLSDVLLQYLLNVVR